MKLFLASENFYVKPDDKESTGLVIMAKTPTVARQAATFSWREFSANLPDPRNVFSPNFDIIELGKFTWATVLKDKLKSLPEMQTGGVSILQFFEDPCYSQSDKQLREIIAARFDPIDKPFAYSDELKRIRGTYFSFHCRLGWQKVSENHFGLNVDVWVSPDYKSFHENTIMKENR